LDRLDFFDCRNANARVFSKAKVNLMLVLQRWSLIACLMFGATAFAADSPKAVATVNGNAIPQANLEFLVKARIAEGAVDTPEMRKTLHDYLVDREILAQEAVREGLDRDPKLVGELEQSKRALLAASLLQQYRDTHVISEEALHKEYERQKAMLGDKEYLPLHILVANESDAVKVIDQLKQGADFATLAKERSIDTVTGKTGGTLNWSIPSSFVKPFSDALVSLKKDEYTRTPVKTKFGWHVIKLQDERPIEPPTFDQVKGNLAEGMQRQQVDKLIEELRGKATIVVN
jgi:peptidyl-prolyl cis-trans isomerase C